MISPLLIISASQQAEQEEKEASQDNNECKWCNRIMFIFVSMLLIILGCLIF